MPEERKDGLVHLTIDDIPVAVPPGTLVWAALLILVAIGVASFQAIATTERFAIGWHVSVRQHAPTVVIS